MTEVICTRIYFFVLICFSGAALLFLAGRAREGLWAAASGLFACGTSLLLVMAMERRLPVYGPFEAIIQMVLVAGGAGFYYARKKEAPSRWTDGTIWFACVFMLCVFLPAPKVLNADFYLYDSPVVLLFFNLRLVAMGSLFYSLIVSLESLGKGADSAELLHRGRNFLMLGSCFYLASEFAGCLWSLNGWGDSWSWSKGFFRSSILFLIMMVGCHLPPKWLKANWGRAMAGAVPAFVILAIFLSSHFSSR